MECPRCREVCCRRFWKPSQWRAWSPYTAEFNCCRECNPDNLYVDYNDLLAEWNSCLSCVKYISETPGLKHIEGCLVRWMGMPKFQRKWLSYYGGLRRRGSHRSCGWPEKLLSPLEDEKPRFHYYSDEKVFDPGNYVYMLGTRLLWPQLRHENHWNAETLGDMWESFLGYADLPEEMLCKMSIARSSETALRSKSFARWIDAYMYSVYRLCLLGGNSVWGVHTLEQMYSIVQLQHLRATARWQSS